MVCAVLRLVRHATARNAVDNRVFGRLESTRETEAQQAKPNAIALHIWHRNRLACQSRSRYQATTGGGQPGRNIFCDAIAITETVLFLAMLK
jgi:hypothetical protein